MEHTAELSIRGETYRGSSLFDGEHALRDLLLDMPEDASLRVSRKAGLLA
ncbi:hypothetical protein Dxin01_00154 [Deinococcus xinjiangensis]|uniref:Uncharacterized protein n=1 Tax=Deinococcus xinjiangensis TaxID=457454 RepID=A0ABP9V8W8_9DEIO